MDWSEQMKTALVAAVEQHGTLYNMQLKSYKDQVVRENAWKEIANRFNSSGAECHKEWRKIREKYVKEKSKLKGKSGDEAKLRQKWPMYDCLFFLNPFISSRKCIGTQEDTQTATELLASMQQPINSGHENSNEELLSEQLETMNEDLYEDIPLVHSAASPPIIVSQFMASIPPVHQQITTSSRSTTPSSVTSSSSDGNKRKKKHDELADALKDAVQAYTKNSATVPTEERDDECTLVGKAVAANLRKMSTRNRALANKQIFDVLFNILNSDTQAT